MIDKTTNPEDFDSEATYPSNWVMRGTKVLDGHGIMEVKQVGDATQYGQVAEKATEISGEETPLNRQLNGLAKFIGVAGFALAILTFGTLFIKDLITHPITWGQFGLLGRCYGQGNHCFIQSLGTDSVRCIFSRRKRKTSSPLH